MIAEIKKNQERIDNAQKLMLDGQLDITEYRSIKQKYETFIKELEAEMKPQLSNTKDYKQYLDFGFNLLQNIDGVYVSGNTQLKSQILSSIFAEKLVFQEKTYRTLVYHEALGLILNTGKALAKNKKGQNAGNSNLSSLVASTGLNNLL